MFGLTLRQKSEKAQGVFRSIVEDLSRINVEAEEKSNDLSSKIQELQEQKEDFDSLIQENDKFMERIKSIYS